MPLAWRTMMHLRQGNLNQLSVSLMWQRRVVDNEHASFRKRWAAGWPQLNICWTVVHILGKGRLVLLTNDLTFGSREDAILKHKYCCSQARSSSNVCNERLQLQNDETPQQSALHLFYGRHLQQSGVQSILAHHVQIYSRNKEIICQDLFVFDISI
jgi:hypothetical protein